MKWALITGSSSGLGRELALSFANHSYSVIVHYYKNYKAAKKTAQEIEAIGVKSRMIRGDFSSCEGVENFLHSLMTENLEIAVLINNVGPYSTSSPAEISTRELQRLYQTNLFSTHAITQGVFPVLKKHEGTVINIGFPQIESLNIRAKANSYVMAKQSVFFLTKILAKEYCSQKVRVNMISPGYLPNSEELPQITSLPLKRCVDFTEITSLALYLASESARSITGQNISVAGAIGL